MKLEESIILAFDIRNTRANNTQTPATVDVNVWHQPDQGLFDEILNLASKDIKRNALDIRSPLNLSFISCIPDLWVNEPLPLSPNFTLTAFLSNQIGSSRDAFRFNLLSDPYLGCPLGPSDLKMANWKTLGFDICDDTLSTSLLYTPLEEFSIDAFERMKKDVGLNKNGLFENLYLAEKYCNENDKLLEEHGLFSPVEVVIKS